MGDCFARRARNDILKMEGSATFVALLFDSFDSLDALNSLPTSTNFDGLLHISSTMN